MDRRKFVHHTASGVLTATSLSQLGARGVTPAARYKAIAFDAFPIFDPRPIAALSESLFPGRGAELIAAWRTRQFEYQWLRALGGQYADFVRTTDDALVFAAKSLKLELSSATREQLVQAYTRLTAWPDVAPALEAFKRDGVRLALLSNMNPAMLTSNVANARLNGMFEHVLSTDSIKSYKPDPRAYQLGVDAFKLRREEILFVAFAGWDVAGAAWFGYPTVWLNRLGAPAESLGAKVVATVPGMEGVAALVRGPA